MNEWVATAERLRKPPIPLPEILATIHNDFERIHPFLDGNGRTSRLILNLLLGRLGYPPAVIYKRDRERYLRAMRRAAAVRGRLKAVRGDDERWRSSRKWVERYEATKGSHIAKNRSARS